jgi:hypothetical protein
MTSMFSSSTDLPKSFAFPAHLSFLSVSAVKCIQHFARALSIYALSKVPKLFNRTSKRMHSLRTSAFSAPQR